MFNPPLKEYIELSKTFNVIPVSHEYPADIETPITVFWKTFSGYPSFLLESVEGGEKLARYSFIGTDPYLMYSHKGKTGVVQDFINGNVRKVEGNPFNILEKLILSCKAPLFSGLPRFFGGVVGYFSYELVRWLERLPHVVSDDLGLWDGQFLFSRTVLVFDHVRHSLHIIVNSFPDTSPEKAYMQAISKIEEILSLLSRNKEMPPLKISNKSNKDKMFESNMMREQFKDKVRKAKEYIRKGDILQVVLSQRFRKLFSGDPFLVYRRLRTVNPSPYLYFLNFGDVIVAGSSPEMLVRVEGKNVETRPIAGTRPRGRTDEEDERLARELLGDAKERAEHLMLVDLGRNDLGRVCRTGSVRVPQFMVVEKYSHVMHLVSSVRGFLENGRSAFDALKACFPAGTVSGAPKVRAMEIIEELEPVQRGPYAGAVGYIGFNGNLDTAITIRTIIFHRDSAYIQAGAGIVADSDPDREYLETVNKAKALLETLDECI